MTQSALATFPVVNPATEEVVAELPIADDAAVDTALAEAHDGQRAWAAIPPSRRGEILWRWADLVVANAAKLGQLDSTAMGKPLQTATDEAASTGAKARYWAGMADKVVGSQIPAVPGYLSYTTREPLGVVGVIIPWNGPTSSFVGKVACALACGNAVVVKPSELAPLSAAVLADLAEQAGIPPATIRVLTGDGRTGGALSANAGVNGIAFTGSVATGRAIATAAAPNFTPLVLELGGKSPNIVFADADMDAAVAGSVWGIFYNSGQVCCAGTRVLVERSVAEEFVQRVVALSRRIRTGDPATAVHLGPVASRAQYERVRSYIDSGRRDGAQIRVGGGRPNTVGDSGFYIEPTVFSADDPALPIATEEIFGPVLTVIPFDGEKQAIDMANDSEYGLSANVWSRDAARLIRVAEAVVAGTVWANSMRLFHPALPFGGAKSSGTGNTAGFEAIDGFTRVKRISILYGAGVAGPAWSDLESS